MTLWSTAPKHQRWLADETDRLLGFTEASIHPDGGFAWLDGTGRPELDRPVENWLTTRITHVMAIGHLLGRPDCGQLVDHGVAALNTVLRDTEHGGWFAATDRPHDGEKRAYEHAFVVLAAASATVAQRPGAEELLDEALAVMGAQFWDESRGVVADQWNRDWTVREPYGGANANMHTIEAFIAAADVTGDRRWFDRAMRINDFFINRGARARSWRIPEHFDVDWNEVPEYNADRPADQFRPYGVTVGHGFEWSRLCLNLSAQLGEMAPPWLVESARGLFARAVADGWRDGGFVYTTDWDGRTVVNARLQWVVCEAIGAAAALHRVTGEPLYEQLYRKWWDVADRHFIDRINGSWHAELDHKNRPASTIWSGKPDTCHAIQATLVPRLPLAPSLASAVGKGLLETS